MLNFQFGSLHIDGRNYDISPVPDDLLHQDVDRSTGYPGTPHFLKEVKAIDKRNTSDILHFNNSVAVIGECALNERRFFFCFLFPNFCSANLTVISLLHK